MHVSHPYCTITITRLALGAVALFVFSIPSESGATIPGVGSLSRLLGLVAITMVGLSLFDRGRLRLRAPTLFLVLAAAFVAWGAVTYFWSVAPPSSISRTVQNLQLFALAWMVHQIARTERDRDVLMQAFVFGCYLMILIAVAAFLGGSRVGYRDVGFSINSFAIVAALAIPMAWGLVLRSSFPLLRALNAAYPVLALFAVVLAASRGGLLTALVGLVVIPLTLPRLRPVWRMMLVAAVSAAVWSVFTWLPVAAPDLQRNFERLGRVEEDLVAGTMSGRTGIWAAGVEVFLTSPIVGVGVGAYNRAVEPILGSARSAHNAFLAIAVTTGLVGLLLFAGMFAMVFVGLMAHSARHADYFVLLAALIVATMPANNENNKYLWFILAILSAARPVMVRVDASVRQRHVRRAFRGANGFPLPRPRTVSAPPDG